VTRGVDDLLADLAEAADAAAELVRLRKERWDTERPLRLAGEAIIGRLGDIATKLPDEVIKATPEIPWREVKGRYRSASSSDPCASSSAAATVASSASAAVTPAGNPARITCTVAACPPRCRPGQLSASSRAARPQSRAACAWRIASTGNPCSANHPAAAPCSAVTSPGVVRRNASCSRSANR
jgi:hypothetical protein